MRNLILFLWLLTGQALADLHWQPSTGETKAHQGSKAHAFKLVDGRSGTNSSVELIHSDLERSVLSSGSALFRIKSTGKNNYHALIAHENGDKYRRMAVRYLYLNGKPVDYSPSDLLAVGLGAFEIVPDPLPREHWRYTSGKKYSFLLKFEGELLSDQPVLVMTEFGASEILRSDASGRLEILIPNDFPEVKPGRRANPPGELRLFSEITRGGIEYQTSLSAEYRVSSESWKSVNLGAGVALGGLVFGFWLNRRLPVHSRRKKK